MVKTLHDTIIPFVRIGPPTMGRAESSEAFRYVERVVMGGVPLL